MKARFFYAPHMDHLNGKSTWPKLYVLSEDGILYSEYLDYMNPKTDVQNVNFDSFKAQDYKFSNYQPLKEINFDEAMASTLTRQENWVEDYVTKNNLNVSPQVKANPFGTVATPDNYEEKSICCFVVDTSSSMRGLPIDELNNGLREFYQEIKSDSVLSNRLEIAVVEFNKAVNTVVPPNLASKINLPVLTTKGTTKLVDGVHEAFRIIEDRKKWYRDTAQPYLRPWIILITDGAPDSDQDINGLQNEIEAGTKERKFVFLPIGVKNADMEVLNQISGFAKNVDDKFEKIPAKKIDGLKFSEFFHWVSSSFQQGAATWSGGLKI